MTTVLTEGKHAGEFLVSEANGARSRSTIVVASGQNLVAGQIFQLSGGEAVAFDAAVDTDGALIVPVAGIMWDNVDASASGANADVPGQTTIVRDAEVNLAELTFPTETTDGGEQALGVAGLALLGITCR